MLQADHIIVAPSTICFESSSDISLSVSGWGEGFGGRGKYRLDGERISFSTDQPFEGWIWQDEGQDRFSCNLAIAGDKLSIARCNEGVADATFVKVPEDLRLRGFGPTRIGTSEEVAKALLGCWDWTLQSNIGGGGVVAFCFKRDGRLLVSETEFDAPIGKASRRDDRRYRFLNDKLLIEGYSGRLRFFDFAKLACDVVIKPGAKLRLADCIAERTKLAGALSFDLLRETPKTGNPLR